MGMGSFDVVLAIVVQANGPLSMILPALAQARDRWELQRSMAEPVGDHAVRSDNGFVVEIGGPLTVGGGFGR